MIPQREFHEHAKALDMQTDHDAVVVLVLACAADGTSVRERVCEREGCVEGREGGVIGCTLFWIHLALHAVLIKNRQKCGEHGLGIAPCRHLSNLLPLRAVSLIVLSPRHALLEVFSGYRHLEDVSGRYSCSPETRARRRKHKKSEGKSEETSAKEQGRGRR